MLALAETAGIAKWVWYLKAGIWAIRCIEQLLQHASSDFWRPKEHNLLAATAWRRGTCRRCKGRDAVLSGLTAAAAVSELGCGWAAAPRCADEWMCRTHGTGGDQRCLLR